MDLENCAYDFGSLNIDKLLMEFFTLRKALSAAGKIAGPCGEERIAVMSCDCPATGLYSDDELELAIAGDCFPPPLAGTGIDAFYRPNDDIGKAQEEGYPDGETSLMKLLQEESSKKLIPVVDEVLNVYETEHSPIYSDKIDKETISPIVDQVVEAATARIPGLEDLCVDLCFGYWGRHRLIRALAEAIILNEIFMVRRPNRRRVKLIL